MRPEYRSVTLRELLSHYSGLPHDVSDLKYFNGFFSDARPLPRQRLDYVVRALKDAPVVPPGTAFSYSNTGFVIAAVIAERAAGMPFEKLMRREVFQPLGMTSAGYGQPGAGEPRGHVGGKPAAMNDGNPLMFAPAGNIHLSLRDWAKFCLDQLDGPTGGGRLLTAASYRLMQTAPAGKEVGLGWGVVDSVAGRKGPALTHAGSDGNWYAVVVLFPTLDDGALVVANAGENMGGDKAARAALKALLPDLAPSQ
jgi:CubicO group peptidase (beta-lactamase class C family)